MDTDIRHTGKMGGRAKAEIGTTLPEAKECRGPHKVEEARKAPPLLTP